jgi:ornithine--oxo-acid transaminase
MEEQQRLFHFQMMKMQEFWTFTEGFIKIAYDDTDEAALKSNVNIAGFLVEPIQGEAGVYVPTEGYFESKALCAAHNVLFIADEVQTGSQRGRLLASGNCSCTNG